VSEVWQANEKGLQPGEDEAELVLRGLRDNQGEAVKVELSGRSCDSPAVSG